MSTTRPPTQIADNTADSRFEIRTSTPDGEVLAGFAAYELHGEHITFTHTEIADQFEGLGFGGALAAGALDAARAAGRLVTPLCPFIAAYIRRHPEYRDIVDPQADFR